MAKKAKYNHRRRIINWQPSGIKSIYPGMITQFNYIGEKIFDEKPLVLVVWNDYSDHKIHGINLNYLSEDSIKKMVNEVASGAGVYSDADFSLPENMITEQDQDDGTYDDNLPYRNILREPFTRIKLPTFREKREGNPLSKSEAKRQMKMLYNKVIKKLNNRFDAYRTYNIKNMKTIKVIRYDIEGLLK